MRVSRFLKLLLLSTLLNFELCSSYRILGICGFNGFSHFSMLEKLMKGLAKKGHQVDVVSHFPQKEKIPNYNDLSLAGSLPDVHNNVSYGNVKHFVSSYFWVKNLMLPAGYNVCELLDHPVMQKLINNENTNNAPYDLVIMQEFFSPCYYAFGRKLKIPMIAYVTSVSYEWMNDPFGNPANPSFVPGGSLSYSGHMNFPQRLVNTVSTTMAKTMYNYYASQQNKYVEKYFGPGFPDVYDLRKDVALVLVNSHFSLNGVRPFTPAVVEVGGLHIEDDNKKKLPSVIQKWLDESHHGFVYISFGSMLKIESMPEEILKAFYATFKAIAPVRVLVKVAKKEELLPGLPGNVKTFSWFPQIQILKHKNIKAFFTHGGIMGSLESIYFGVPMIGMPFFVDQFSNINNYVQRNCAIALDFNSLNEKKLTTAFKKILEDPIYRESTNRFRKLYFDRPAKPLDTAIFWVEYIARNGNVLRSPAVDLEWWQLQLLDIYAVLFITLSITCYFLYLLIRILLKCSHCLITVSFSFTRKQKKD